MAKEELYISVDVETTGPIPGTYSLYQVGAAVVGDESQTFFRELKLLNENFTPGALESCGVTMEELKGKGIEPVEAMRDFARWIETVAAGKRPVFVGFNATFDWMFVHWYFHTFLGLNPFGISGLDIKAYYMGMRGCRWGETRKHTVRKRFPSSQRHTHQALDDAVEQAQIFQQMLEYNAQLRKAAE